MTKYFKISLLLLVVLLIIGRFWYEIYSYTGEENLYVHQAKAFLEGHLDIPQYYHDVAIYNGRFYLPFPPFPALLLVPFVAIFGIISTKPVLISIALSVLNVIILMRILKKLGIDSKTIYWLVAAFFLGTAYWSAAYLSYIVWLFAQVVAVTCMFLAINEALGKGRGVLTGLYLGMAFLSRYACIFAAIFLIAVLWENKFFTTRRSKLSNVLGFVISVGLCVCVFLILNWIRFGNVFETGYNYISYAGFLKERFNRFGSFHPAYVPFNFINMFLQGFHIVFSPPTYLRGFRMDPFGTSITFASPFVFIAFLAKWKKRLLWTAWISITIVLVHQLFFIGNGYTQVNTQRYTLDFLPILILLVALGTKRVKENLWKAAMLYSIILNVVALLCVPLLRRVASLCILH